MRVRCLRLVIAAFAAVVAVSACTGAPTQEMSDARQAIAVAREAGASTSAGDELAEAERYLESAQDKLQRRLYQGARQDAMQAKNKALEALAASQNAVTDHER